MQMQLQVMCAEQRDRFRSTHPSLSNYEFDTMSVHSHDTLPQYEFGSATLAVRRHAEPGIAHPDPARYSSGIERSNAVTLCTDPRSGMKRWCENPADDALMEITPSAG